MRRPYWLLSVVALAGASACSEKGKPGAPVEAASASVAPTRVPLPTLRVGIQVSPAMALVMIAEERRFFDAAGLDVVLQEFTAGKFALQAFLGGSLDLAVSGEVPVALSMLQGNRFRVLTQVVERTVNEVRVVARADGAAEPAAFFRKKRKLATSFGGGPEFFTHRFLTEYGIRAEKVELISQKPEDMPAALLSGAVDAISIFDPFAYIAESKLGSKAITFRAGDVYSELYVVSVNQATIDTRRSELSAFVRGLFEAARFAATNVPESQAIVARFTKLEPAVVAGVWGSFVFKPALGQLFVDYTKAEAEWAIQKGTFPQGTPVPDYAAAVYRDLVAEVAPEAVTMMAP